MDETLRLGELVEPLGFDSIWATEHYGSAYSMQPNPLQYLAYWAGRTSRVDLGTAVVVAPWWNPVRLASEISMLDILLKGRRLHLGIGRGVAPHEYASLGIPIEESHTYFYDVVNALRAADGAERFTFDGQVFKIPPTTIRPAGPPQGRPHHADQGRVHHRDVGAARGRERARSDVRVRRRLRGDDRQGAAVQPDPQRAWDSRPTSRRRCCGCTAPRPRSRPRRAGSTSTTSCSRRSTTTSSGTTPASRTSRGTRATRASQSADVGRADDELRGAPGDAADRHTRRDHRAHPVVAVGDQPRGSSSSTSSTAACRPRRRRESLRLFAGEGAPGGAGHGHADQPRVARGRRDLKPRACPSR